MFSEEFMRYLINYQKAEPQKIEKSPTMTIPFKSNKENKKLATILLAVRK
ncbi:hypothetical protein IJ818_05930 [bacterium]|nr:hypothetical protein [bacterium]